MKNDNDVAAAFVATAIAVVLTLVIFVLVHYYSRARDWWRWCTDDPELYALTDGERNLFLISAWAFPAETALLFAGSLAAALGGTAGFAVPAAVFGGILILSLVLVMSGGAEPATSSVSDGDFYDGRWD
jgi:hypothetical protein